MVKIRCFFILFFTCLLYHYTHLHKEFVHILPTLNKRFAIIKRVINLCKKVFTKNTTKKTTVTHHVTTHEQPIVLTRDQHPVSRQLISPNALKVLYRLNKSGFDAYLVGGGVRDILLGQKPKDFDIATNATPDEI